MDDRRPLGRSGLVVPAICFGTSPLASMPRLYGYRVSAERAEATIEAVLDSPAPFLDTSNGYGEHGEAERAIGAVLGRRAAPTDLLLATKVDPSPGSADFSGDRVRASFEESLERLGVDRVPLLHLHDPERIPFEQGIAADGPLAALVDLRDRGLVDAIGVAGGPVGLLRRYLDTGELSVVLSHNRFSLLDHSAEALFRHARERGVGVLNAAPYGGGMLAKGPEVQPRYAYGSGGDAQRVAAVAMAAACRRYDVPLAAAALQHSLRSPLVDATVVGVSAPERVAETLALAETAVPDGLWAELAALAPGPEAALDPA